MQKLVSAEVFLVGLEVSCNTTKKNTSLIQKLVSVEVFLVGLAVSCNTTKKQTKKTTTLLIQKKKSAIFPLLDEKHHIKLQNIH